jgi:outer membrane immunogenic protein
MRKFNAILATAAAVTGALAASPALAQADADATFTGPRVEGLLGYDATKAGSSVNGGGSRTADGLLYGVGAGFDVAAGGAVVGVEGEFSDSTAKRGYNNAVAFGRVRTGRDLYVGARAGLRATPATLLYVKGGYTNGRYKVSASNGTTDLRSHFNADGWRVGAGVEHTFGRNTYAKVEYRYSNYTSAKVAYPSGATTNRFDVDLDRHQVVAGVGVRF